MSRPLRLEFPGALWHVLNRGVERRPIFLHNEDRRLFLTLLERAVDRHRWRIHAYVLMSNHYHLLFETPETTLSRGMRELDGDYASTFNRRYSRVGHLFQGRFKSHLIDSEAYLLQVARYVVLNPVRARLVAKADEWVWSSYRSTAGLAAVPCWLDPVPVLERFHRSDRSAAMENYRAFVATAGSDSPWDHLVAQAFLGGPGFLAGIEQRLRAWTCSPEHPRQQRAFRGATLDRIRAAFEAEGCLWPPQRSLGFRAAFALLVTRHTDTTRADLGRCLGMRGQAVGYLVKSAEKRIEGDRAFAALISRMEADLHR